MRKVDDAEHGEGQREADGDDGVGAADDETVGELLQEQIPPRDLVQPTADGLSLETYQGTDANDIDINGELSKLAFNISLGHGIHAGIHFRSSTVQSILLGEQVALSVLQDKANCYNEKFSVTFTKFDGTTAAISN